MVFLFFFSLEFCSKIGDPFPTSIVPHQPAPQVGATLVGSPVAVTTWVGSVDKEAEKQPHRVLFLLSCFKNVCVYIYICIFRCFVLNSGFLMIL